MERVFDVVYIVEVAICQYWGDHYSSSTGELIVSNLSPLSLLTEKGGLLKQIKCYDLVGGGRTSSTGVR